MAVLVQARRAYDHRLRDEVCRNASSSALALARAVLVLIDADVVRARLLLADLAEALAKRERR